MARTAQIGEFVEVVSGPAFKSAHFTDDPSDVPLIKGDNVAQGYIAWDKSKYWPANDTEGYERFGLGAGDIVLAMDRPWVTAGLKWARLKPHDPAGLLVQRVARLRAKAGLSQDYLTYVIASVQFSEYVRNIMGGTNVPHISGAQIKAFKFRLPGENEQAAIADILSAYDDLIETNRRRIALLEEAARMLYREWFVHFRFPGHEHVPLTDGLPNGWERRTLDSLFATSSGGTPSRKKPEYYGGAINWLKTQELKNGYVFETDEKITEDGLRGSSAKLFPANTVIVAMYGATIGQLGILAKPSTTNQACCALLPFDNPQDFLFGFSLMDHLRPSLKDRGQGAAQNNISQQVIRSLQITVPTRNLINNFNESVGPMFYQKRTLEEQNQKLAQARDLLLPRVMNGEIAV